MLKINDKVIYTYYKCGTIENVHYDDFPNLYYTLNLGNKSPQTTQSNFYLKNKVNKNKDLDKGDEVVYFKEYETKILDIKDNKYKILYKDVEKYVSERRLRKINLY